MKHLFLLAALCLAVSPVHADDHDDDEDGPYERPGIAEEGSGPKDSHFRRRDDDDERGRRGSRGEGGGGRMGREKGGEGRRGGFGGGHIDSAMKEKFEKTRAAHEKVRELTKKLRQAKESEKPALKKEARAALSELFDARLAMEQSMVDKMSEHLAEKKEKLAKKKAAKDKLVDEKLDKLAGDAPSWDD